jgi:dihydrofolate reductase/pimeloyl-ACP methyl ester carboxylesterase
MGKILIGLSMSLDGFIADQNDDVSEVFAWMGAAMEQFHEVAGDALNEAGAVIMGHRSFDQIYSENGWVFPDGTAPDWPVIVLQSQPREPEKKGKTQFYFVTDGIQSAIAKARELAGEKNIALHGASAVQQALREELLDEINLSIAHVLLGEGVRLFDHLGSEPIHLEHIRTVESPGATHLTFRVVPKSSQPAALPGEQQKGEGVKKIQSADGTTIAFDQMGQGPAIVLVDGALGSRASGYLEPLAALLAPHFTVFTYDRRGRGESTDTPPFAVEREIEDIDALIDAAGGEACLYGISSGACLALEAAARLGHKVKKLALYEPPYDSADDRRQAFRAYREQLAESLAEGRRGDALGLFMMFVGMPPEHLGGMRQHPLWPKWEAVAHTLPYDAAAMGDDGSVPIETAARLTVPTLIIDGSATMPFIHVTAAALAGAIPHARRRTLEGQTHEVDAAALAPVLEEFFAS